MNGVPHEGCGGASGRDARKSNRELGDKVGVKSIAMTVEAHHPGGACRVVQVVGQFGTGGGVEAVARELAGAFDRAGVECTTLAYLNGDSTQSADVRLVAPFLGRIPTRGRSPFRYVGRMIVVPVFTLAATLAVRRFPSAAIISHGDSLHCDILVVHSLHAAMIDVKRRAGVWKWLLNPLNLWLAARDRFVIRGSRYKKLVAVSPRVASELERFHGVPHSRISIIPNGVDVAKFKPDVAARERIREAFGIPLRARVLLFVGHEFSGKGLDHAIGALERLDDDVHLLVVGADNPQPFASRYSGRPDRLVFAGERRDMADIYAAADALVLPSSYETFSLACLEAMACGVPVFATRVGGVEDYLDQGINGYFIERDAADIAAKIGSPLRDESELARLREGALETARSYSWDRVASRYGLLVDEVQNEKHQGAKRRSLAQYLASIGSVLFFSFIPDGTVSLIEKQAHLFNAPNHIGLSSGQNP